MLRELKQEDPEMWLKLQKYPQFRPLCNTALGLNAAEKHLDAGIGLITGKVTGSIEKWMETTLKDMMKRDRFGPYAEVLGSKATTLPTPAPPQYSNSRLGHYLKTEDARAAQAAKAAAKELENSRAAVRASRGTALTRGLSPLLDLELGALDPEVHSGVTNFSIEIKLKRALAAGLLDDEQYTTAHNLMAQGKYEEMQAYLDALAKARR